MNHFEAFFCLHIPITKDISTIKKAYQKLISQHHPEEDPEGFMYLHQAYKTALAYARGTNSAKVPSGGSFWQPEETHSSRDETGYDSLFADLGREQTSDVSPHKKDFTKKLLKLKLHWLPIPLKCWRRFFSSDVFRLCRAEAECLDSLFELVLGKVHTYGVFRFLLNRLWELNSWQTSEDLEAPANKTRKCIAELSKQYSHYLKLNPANHAKRLIFSLLWYYQALPFFFKLLVSTVLMPLISCGSTRVLVLLLLGFYALELYIWHRKKAQQLGRYHPVIQEKKHFLRIEDPGIVIAFIIYVVIIHFCICINIMLTITGLPSASLLS